LINSMVAWMTTSISADELYKHVKDVIGKGAKNLVLKLWKFVNAKSLCFDQQIPEHTRNEFDFYGTTMVANKTNMPSLCEHGSFDTHSFLPMEWSHYNLSQEQKLKIYEHVVQTGKLLSKPTVQFNELQAEAEEQMKVLAALTSENKGEKTHLQVISELRDYKRRRQSYRGKNKANRKMTGLEVLREVVDQQMLYLQILRGKKNQDNATTAPSEEGGSHTSSAPLAKCTPTSDDDPLSKKIIKPDVGSSLHNERRRSRSNSRSKDRHRSRERRQNRISHKRRSRSRERYSSKTANDRRRRRSGSRGRDRHRSDRSRSIDKDRHRRDRSTDSKSSSKKVLHDVTYY